MNSREFLEQIALLAVLSLVVVVSYGPIQEMQKVNYELSQLDIFQKSPSEQIDAKPRLNAWGGQVEVRRADSSVGDALVYTGVSPKGCIKLGFGSFENGLMAIAVNGVGIPVGEKIEKKAERLIAACKDDKPNSLTFVKASS